MFAAAAARYKKRTPINPIKPAKPISKDGSKPGAKKNRGPSRQSSTSSIGSANGSQQQASNAQSLSHTHVDCTIRRGSLLTLLPLPHQLSNSPNNANCNACSNQASSSQHTAQHCTTAAKSQGLTVTPLHHLGSSATNLVGSRRGSGEVLPLVRKRSGSAPLLQFTLAFAWNLKPDHVRALKVTWSRLCDTPRSNCRGILAIMERVFEKFEYKEKALKDVFYNSAFVDSMTDCTEKRSLGLRRRSDTSIATLRDHIHFFVSLISQVIQSLEKCPQDIFEHIDKIGCFHAHLKRYGFNSSMWDKLGVCLVDGLVVQDCVRGYPEACRAWTMMVATLIDRLRSAPTHITALTTLNSASHYRNRQKKASEEANRPTSPIPPNRANFNLASLALVDSLTVNEEDEMLRSRSRYNQRSHSQLPSTTHCKFVVGGNDSPLTNGNARQHRAQHSPVVGVGKNVNLLGITNYLSVSRKSIV